MASVKTQLYRLPGGGAKGWAHLHPAEADTINRMTEGRMGSRWHRASIYERLWYLFFNADFNLVEVMGITILVGILIESELEAPLRYLIVAGLCAVFVIVASIAKALTEPE